MPVWRKVHEVIASRTKQQLMQLLYNDAVSTQVFLTRDAFMQARVRYRHSVYHPVSVFMSMFLYSSAHVSVKCVHCIHAAITSFTI